MTLASLLALLERLYLPSCYKIRQSFCSTSDNLNRLTYVIDYKIFAGIIFFFVSLSIFIIATHRVVVWVPLVALVSV